jgi:hypothetical protein
MYDDNTQGKTTSKKKLSAETKFDPASPTGFWSQDDVYASGHAEGLLNSAKPIFGTSKGRKYPDTKDAK